MTTAVQVQYRRGTSSQVAAFTGAQGEMVVDTTNNRLVVQDGSTAGGWPAAKLGEAVTNTRTAVADTSYTAQTTDRSIAYTAISAARTVTLPATASFPTGTRLTTFDESGSCSATNSITLSPNGTDTIDGASSAVIKSAYGYLALQSNGAGKWTILDQAGGASGGVSSVNALAGALSLAATDGASIAASGTTLSIGGPGGMVNKFRNGAMDVWQRGTGSFTVTTSGSYAADGWIVLPAGASVTAAQAGGRLLTKNALQVTGASSVTDVIIKQRIESLIAAAFCSQTVTVQAQVYNGTGGAITPKLTVNHAASQDSWLSPVTDVSAVSLQSCASSGWTLLSYTFSASASSYNGLEIVFDFGNNLAAGTKTISMTECDIRVTPGAATGLNSNPPPPELRPVVTELAFCQRYFYQRNASAGTSTSAPDIIAIFVADSSSGAWGKLIDFPVTMRAAPTPGISSFGHVGIFNASGSSSQNFSGSSANWITSPWCISSQGFTGASGLSAGNAGLVWFSSSSGWISASAEL